MGSARAANVSEKRGWTFMRCLLAMRTLALIAPLCVGSCIAQPVKQTFKTPWADYTLTFDPQLISADDVTRLARISPYDFYASSIPDLEYCVTSNCNFNLRTGWRAPNYYSNAHWNLRNAKEEVQFLQNLSYPEELRPWVQYLLRLWSFNTWLEETRLDFYKTWDTEVLKRKYENLDPAKSCSGPIRSIQAANEDHDTQYMLAKFGWSTCLTEKYQAEIGVYSAEPWKHFLRNYHIIETVKPQAEDTD